MEDNREYKTKDYVRRAQNNYRKKFDQVVLRLPKGASEVIKENLNRPVSTYITELVLKDLKENHGIEF